MPGLSKVIVLDPDARAGQQVQLGFEREGVPAATLPADAATLAHPLGLAQVGDAPGLVVVGGVDDQALELVRGVRKWLDDQRIDAPIVFAGRGVPRDEAEAAGADEIVLRPAYLRDVVTIGRLLRGVPAAQRSHLVGSLVELSGVFTLVRALASLGRSATLTLVRGLRRGEVRFYHGEVTSAQVGMIHGQAALHQLLLWTDARFDYHHEDIVRRHQIPLSHHELFADAERFLEGVRDSSGALSPSMVLEQDIARVQSFGRQIPTEVYGVLRMFDGYRVLADVLEDSPYRVFETLRVAQRAVEVGLLRAIAKQPVRATWRAVLSIEEWLVGSGSREADRNPARIDAQPKPDTRPPSQKADASSGPVARDARSKAARKPRRKKRRRVDTPPATPVGAAAGKDIDWGALVPRIVGAEVGTLSGVVPASHVSGEIVAMAPAAPRESLETQPSVVFDEAAELARDASARAARAAEARARADAETAAADARADADRRAAEAAEALRASAAQADAELRASAHRVVAATASLSSEPHHAVEELPLDDRGLPPGGSAAEGRRGVIDDTRPERTAAGAGPPAPISVTVIETAGIAIAETATATMVVHDTLIVETTSETTARLTATPITRVIGAEPAPAASAPSEIVDEPSDGVIRQHITTADTAPVKRQRLPSDPLDDDRPEDTMGEITTPRARVTAEPRRSEPSILVADMAALHSAVSEIADEQITTPHTPDVASSTREAAVVTARNDLVAFNEIEEAFFRAGHDKDAVAAPPMPAESFDDLDEGYRPVGFWGRLRGKASRAAAGRRKPADPDEK